MAEDNSAERPASSDESGSPEETTRALPPLNPQPKLHINWQLAVTVFQVESTLFSVPKHGFLIPGVVFADMFALPQNNSEEGRDTSNPIVLHDIKADDFAAFLSVLYPWHGGRKRSVKESKTVMISSFGLDLSASEWIGVLCLANRWNFVPARNESIRILSNLLSPGEKVQMGKRYLVEKWVKDGYYDLVSKPGLEIDELAGVPNNFDRETIAKIFYVQAASLAHFGGTYCTGSPCSGTTHSNTDCSAKRKELKDARKLIDNVFKDDIASAYYNSVTMLS